MTQTSFLDRLFAMLNGSPPPRRPPIGAEPPRDRSAPTPAPAPAPAPARVVTSPTPTPTPAAAKSPSGFDFDDERIPSASRDRVQTVRELIDDVGKRAAGGEVGNAALLEVQRMHDVHLPRLLQSYIDIPPAHRSEIFRTTGKSASFVLNDGLDKMAERLRTMSRDLAQGDLDHFTENLRFIEDRYGNEPSPFD